MRRLLPRRDPTSADSRMAERVRPARGSAPLAEDADAEKVRELRRQWQRQGRGAAARQKGR
jgi:hypothetical protein